MTDLANVRLGRALFFGGYLYAWLGYGAQFARVSHIANPSGITAWLNLDPLMGESAYWMATLVWVVLGIGFVLQDRPVVPAALLFLATLLYARIEETYDPGLETVTHGKFLPGVGMAAYAIGAWWSRKNPHESDHFGHEMMCGTAAALYVWAGVVKLLAGGWSWALDVNLGLLIIERAYIAPSPRMASVRFAIGDMPMLTQLMGMIAIAVELLAITMVVPRFRLGFACLVCCMHLSIGTLMGYYYAEWQMCMFGLAIWTRAWPRP